MSTILAIIAALPKILQLIQLFAGMVQEKEQRGIGRKEAIAETLALAHKDITYANSIDVETEIIHAHDNTDDAFDKDFMRKS